VRPPKGVLLDTHVLVWLVRGVQDVSQRVRNLVESDRPTYISAISFVELAIKAQRNTLPELHGLAELFTAEGLRELPVDAASAQAIGRFPGLANHDPFDRILVAQAATHNLTLETADRKLLALGLPHINDARA
jgi:PIN domain nuclease of toxin-antitoxin system